MSENAIVKPTTTIDQFNPDDPVSLYMQPSVFGQLQRVAKLMSHSDLVPPHLRGDDRTADCFLVVAQAFRWRMDPFAVAQHTYVLNGKLGYEGKLVAAVINASPRLKSKLNYEYTGSGPDRQVRVYATLSGEDKPREVSGTVKQWATDRNPKWKDLPDQMLSYRGAREWARRHMPEAVLGVFAEEELEQMSHTSSRTVTVSTDTLDDFIQPEKVVAKDDPKVVEAEVVVPQAMPMDPLRAEGRPELPKPKVEEPKATKKPATKKDQEVDELFG